jgi:hypothetical protein
LTVGQVFGVNNETNAFSKTNVFSETNVYSKPILRIAYLDERHDKVGYLWAIYRVEPWVDSDANIGKWLGPAPNATMIANVKIQYRPNNTNNIAISYEIDGNSVHDKNLTSAIGPKWLANGYHVYHKAGCYLQAAGNCNVDFSSPYFDD